MLIVLFTYIVLVAAYIKGISNIILLFGLKKEAPLLRSKTDVSGAELLLATAADVIFLRRLFRINKILWIGEFLFHITFIIVVLAHLRYIIHPLPRWWSHLVCAGKYAGLLMPFVLLYILVVRISIDYKKYISKGNLLLIVLLILLSGSGVLMRFVMRPDIIAVKGFVIGIFTFQWTHLPDSILFVFHYLLALLLVLYLPSHILTAPFVMAEARKRQP